MLSEIYKALFKYQRDTVNKDNGVSQMVGVIVGGVTREDVRDRELRWAPPWAEQRPPNLYVEALGRNVTVFGHGAFTEVTKAKESHQGGALVQ